jgi:hypothetical protein
MKLPPAVRDSWRWQVFSRRVEIGRLAVALHDDAGFAREIETALDGGGSVDRSRARVQEKQNLLGRYLRAVTDLRNSVYLEPATRFPSMDPREKFMTGQLQVSVAPWEKTLERLRKRLEGGK